MKDRYLFRGKRLDNGEWIVGDLWYPKDNHCVIRAKPPALGAVVDPDTIGQCTGLEDVYGNLIFEGDLLASYLEGSFFDKVIWHECQWQGVPDQTAGTSSAIPLLMVLSHGYDTIIGNIHDNPELLKGGEE